MPNPWELYQDAPEEEGPWTQFAAEPATKAKGKSAPKKERGFVEQTARDYLGKQVRGVVSTVEGIKQGAIGIGQSVAQGGPAGTLARYLAPENDVGQQATEALGREAQRSRVAFDASTAGQSTEGQLTRGAAQYGTAFAIPGGGATVPVRIATAGLGGAASSVLAPVESGNFAEEKAKQAGVGGGFGVVGAAAGEGIRLGAKALQSVTAPLSKKGIAERAQNVLREAALDPASVARVNPSAVPGVNRTLYEESLDPGIAQLQRQFPVQMQEQAAANNAARVKFIRDNFGGASAASEAAKRQAVMAAETPALREARKQTGAETAKVIAWLDRAPNSQSFRGDENVAGFLGNIRNRIAMPIDDAGRLSAARSIAKDAVENKGRISSADFDALREARRLVISAQGGKVSADDVLKAVSKIRPSSVSAQNAIGDIRRALKTVERGKDDVASLYNTRKAITTEMMPKAIKAGDGASVKALHGAVEQLDRQIEAIAPTYRQYLKGYRAGMQEADQVAVGTNLIRRGTAQGEGERAIQPGRFLSATDDLASLLPKGARSRNVKPEKVLTPAQLKAIASVRDDLTKVQGLASSGKAIGSPTKQNFSTGDMIADAAAESLMSRLLKVTPFVGNVSKVIGELSEQKVNTLVIEMLKDPKKARTVLALMPPQQRAVIEARLAVSRPLAAASAGAVPQDQSADR